MGLDKLTPAAGAIKSRKRIGRGQGSGHGGTSTRGHKGAKSRSGYKSKRNHEGGQMPLQMRLPKIGFKNPNRTEYVVFNVTRISEIIEKHNLSEITPESLYKIGVIKKRDLIKVLGHGELASKVNIKAHAFSASAQEKIESKGGKIEKV